MKTLLLFGAALALSNQVGLAAVAAIDPTMTGADKHLKRPDAGGSGGHITSISAGLQIDGAGGGTSFSPDGAIMTGVDNGDDHGSSGGGSSSTAINAAGLTTTDLGAAASQPNGHVDNASIAGAAGHIAPA